MSSARGRVESMGRVERMPAEAPDNDNRNRSLPDVCGVTGGAAPAAHGPLTAPTMIAEGPLTGLACGRPGQFSESQKDFPTPDFGSGRAGFHGVC